MKKEIFVHRPHDYPGLIKRWKKIARVSRLKFSKVGEFDGFGVYEFRSPNLNQTDGIYMSAGIHGDEPGAVEGLTRWAEMNPDQLARIPVIIFPCLNPWGYSCNSRNSRAGDDLNRKWGGDKHPMTSVIQSRIKRFSFRLALTLHEDYDGDGTYLYELIRGSGAEGFGAKILKSVHHIISPDSRNLIDGRKARDGIIRPRPRKIIPDEMPEALHLFKLHTNRSLTIETPSEFDFRIRAEAHLKMIASALCLE